VVPEGCDPNAHLYYLIVEDEPTRAELIRALAARGIGAGFHYVPLHSSPAGRRYGRAAGDPPLSPPAGGRPFRPPPLCGVEEGGGEVVVREVLDYYRRRARRHVA